MLIICPQKKTESSIETIENDWRMVMWRWTNEEKKNAIFIEMISLRIFHCLTHTFIKFNSLWSEKSWKRAHTSTHTHTKYFSHDNTNNQNDNFSISNWYFFQQRLEKNIGKYLHPRTIYRRVKFPNQISVALNPLILCCCRLHLLFLTCFLFDCHVVQKVKCHIALKHDLIQTHIW